MEDAKDADDAGTKFDIVKQALREKRAEAEHAKEKVDEKKPSGQFQITANPTNRDSRLVDWSSPNSLIEAGAAKHEKAISGDGWKSEAFSILGDAPPAGRTSGGPTSFH